MNRNYSRLSPPKKSTVHRNSELARKCENRTIYRFDYIALKSGRIFYKMRLFLIKTRTWSKTEWSGWICQLVFYFKQIRVSPKLVFFKGNCLDGIFLRIYVQFDKNAINYTGRERINSWGARINTLHITQNYIREINEIFTLQGIYFCARLFPFIVYIHTSCIVKSLYYIVHIVLWFNLRPTEHRHRWNEMEMLIKINCACNLWPFPQRFMHFLTIFSLFQYGAAIWTSRGRCSCTSRPIGSSSATVQVDELTVRPTEAHRRTWSGSWQTDLPFSRLIVFFSWIRESWAKFGILFHCSRHTAWLIVKRKARILLLC